MWRLIGVGGVSFRWLCFGYTKFIIFLESWKFFIEGTHPKQAHEPSAITFVDLSRSLFIRRMSSSKQTVPSINT